MKRLFLSGVLLLATFCAVTAATYRVEDVPNVQRTDARRYVSNPDGILSARTTARLDSLCGALRARGFAEVAIVAVDDIAGDDVFDFAVELFRSWGVGNSGSDNGLGVLLVKDRHEIRFLTGYGLEGTLPDALCRRIQETYMLPAFRVDDYDAGMLAGMQAAATVLQGGEVTLDTSRGNGVTWGDILLIFVVIFVVFPVGSYLIRRYSRLKCPYCGKRKLKMLFCTELYATAEYRMEECEYLCQHCGKRFRRQFRSYRDDHFGGPGSGPIIGGGFGGFGGGGSFGGGSFGGGSFGGGGAGSRW